MDDADVERLRRQLQQAGLLLLGGFTPAPDEAVPALANGVRARTVLLVASAGHAMWQVFAPWHQRNPGPHPLDRWTEEQLAPLARDAGMTVCLPFQGPPYWPFQRWAARCASVWPSPLGIFIHHHYGLWHGLRGALLSPWPVPLPPTEAASNPCVSCADQPCLNTCPVSAFDDGTYKVSACAEYLDTAGGQDCMAHGCAARRACPAGQHTRYPPAQMRFHMAAFKGAR